MDVTAQGNPDLNKNNHAAMQMPYWITLAAIAILLLLFQQTALSTVAIWQRSETFAHSYLIFPISAYLIWRQRKVLAAIAPKPNKLGLLLLAGLGFGWLFAELGGVLVVTQYCLVGMIIATVWTVLGSQLTRAITFPLAFLFFSVPAGEFLIPHLMNFTADFAVASLQVTGVPVYREGTFFTIPSGQWSVVEACSGIRYLLASVTLGTLYAYLTYRSFGRRLVFSILSLLVPIVANGLRAYMIVMIAHLSDMKLATGVDHYLYGWVFFGLVMLLLFWVGAFWREDHLPEPVSSTGQTDSNWKVAVPTSRFVSTLVAVLITVSLWPVYGAYLAGRISNTHGLSIALPSSYAGWEKQPAALADWKPHYVGTDAESISTYKKGKQTVLVYLGYYRTQRQGAELINTQNFMIQQEHPVWSSVGEKNQLIDMDGKQTAVQQTLLRAPNQRLLIWNWNHLAGSNTINPYLAKFLLAKNKLFGQRDEATGIVLASGYEESPKPAEAAMNAFLKDMLPSIHAAIASASHQ